MATHDTCMDLYLVLTRVCDEKMSGWLRIVGACLYVSHDVRAQVLRAFAESRMPIILRAVASAIGSNAEFARRYSLYILQHIRELTGNPHIPDSVDLDALIDATPNYVNVVGFVPSPVRLNDMVMKAKTFENAYGDGNFTRVFLDLYREIPLCASRELQSRYDVFVSHVCLGYFMYPGLCTQQDYIKYHLTYLVLWYGLLIEYMIVT